MKILFLFNKFRFKRNDSKENWAYGFDHPQRIIPKISEYNVEKEK